MKKTILATLMSSVIATPVFAASADEVANASQVFQMDNSQGAELATLSSDEMKSTEGAWVPNAIGGGIGFVTGNYSYLVNAAYDPSFRWNFNDYARSVGTATVVGAINPVNSIRGAAQAGVTSFVTAWGFR